MSTKITAEYEREIPSFTFYVHDKEMLSIHQDGSFFVEDRKVTEDKEIYQAFRRWVDGWQGTVHARLTEILGMPCESGDALAMREEIKRLLDSL